MRKRFSRVLFASALAVSGTAGVWIGWAKPPDLPVIIKKICEPTTEDRVAPCDPVGEISAMPAGSAPCQAVDKDASDPNDRMRVLLEQSEVPHQMKEEWDRFWMRDQPKHMTYERVSGGIEPESGPVESCCAPNQVAQSIEKIPPVCRWMTQLPQVNAESPSGPPESAMGNPVVVGMGWKPELVIQEDILNGGQPSAGFQGRMYLFDAQTYAICCNGKLKIFLYNEKPAPGVDTAKPIEGWAIDAEILRNLASQDKIGWGYTLFLPTQRLTPEVTRVRLVGHFETPDNRQICGDAVRMTVVCSSATAELVQKQAQTATDRVDAAAYRLYRLGREYQLQGDMGNAHNSFSDAYELNPDSPIGKKAKQRMLELEEIEP
jgi:hypothetical protein